MKRERIRERERELLRTVGGWVGMVTQSHRKIVLEKEKL
jgi:hypothetical protein